MARIFISYRREDSDIWVGRLASELRKYLPSDQVFQDIASIDPGADFVEALDKALATAAVMLAVIGPRWLTATDRQGRRRLDLPGDFVRQEIAESLRRPGVRVFPLLVNGAEMPSEEELPDPLKPLHRRQAFELTVRHWDNDVAQLVQTLKRAQGLRDDREEDQEPTTPSLESGLPHPSEVDAAAITRPVLTTRGWVAPAPRPDDGTATHKAEQEIKRREAEERAAQEEAQRAAAAEQAGKKADEEIRRKAEQEEARRKHAVEAGRKATEGARRKAPEEAGVQPPKFGWKAVAGIGAVVGAVALFVVFGGGERSEQLPTPPAAAPAPASARAPAVSEALERAVAAGTPAPATKPSESVTPEKPATKPAATDTRRIVINGPRPLYTPFKTGAVFQECAECPEMVVIVPDPSGFTIGTPESQAKWGRDADEKPFGPIRFAKPYAIGKFEVTRAQFKASGVQPAGGCYTWGNEKWQLDQKRNWEQPGFEQGADHPVVCVSWNEVQEYLTWLNRQVGSSTRDAYRLPSEAEWEYAARGGTTTVRFWGNEPERACDYANVADKTAKTAFPNWTTHECPDGFVYTAPVGKFTANDFGLKDIIGNAWEWVQDCYAEQYSESIGAGSAFETPNCGQRVVRGGSWLIIPESARVANRLRIEPGYRNSNLGFRLARTL